MSEADDDLESPRRKKPTRARKIAVAVTVTIGLAVTGGWAYTRYVMVKSPLGGACRWGLQCASAAPKCMRPDEERAGVCSRECDAGVDCAPGIHCVTVELDEVRDERGVPLKGGYCFPQSFIDEKKHKRDAGAAPAIDSWVDIPSSPSQLEGELVLQRGAESKSYVVKGTLVRASPGADKRRTIVDASTMRVYVVDDDKKTFSASSLDAQEWDVKVTKTGKKDRVADRECEIWTLEDGKVGREACVVLGGAFVDPASRSAAPWVRELAVRGALPLRVVETDKSGKETSRTAATRFESHVVDASLFAIPKSYKNLAAK